MGKWTRPLQRGKGHRQWVIAITGLVIIAGGANAAEALDLEGYAEPSRIIKVASDETGTIEHVFVRDGQAVKAGQPLVRLDSELHRAMLAIAEQNMKAVGRLNAAQADLKMRRTRFEKLRSLSVDGHARQEEVDRAAGEVAVSEANVRAVQEDLVVRKLEHAKIKAQIARRTIKAPISGVVVKVLKDVGEYVAPNSPEVLTIVQTDVLLANFPLMRTQRRSLSVGKTVTIVFLATKAQTTGTVDFVSPVTDAESGTVLVKVRVDNPRGRFRSGDRCKMRLVK